ncbi:MAG: hypothetical protein K0U66_04235 [Gammaproteobacteria bacterium]|nr:hypothetical protein [Gammaproteobacteria bacterium]
MHVIENKATRTTTNLGTTRTAQAANGVTFPDPLAWEAKAYRNREDVLAADGNVYRMTQNPNRIPIAGSEPAAFETLRELALRIATLDMESCRVSADKNGFIGGGVGTTAVLTCSETEPTTGIGRLTGRLTLTADRPFVWNGRYNSGAGEFSSTTPPEDIAVLETGGGTAVQVWLIESDGFDFAKGFKEISLAGSDFDFTGGNYPVRVQFSGGLVYPNIDTALTDLYGYQNPKHLFTRAEDGFTEDGTFYRAGDIIEPIADILPDNREFIADIVWWTRVRAKAEDSFFDEKPAIGVGRNGAVQVSITSPTPFDSVALVNCIGTQAEVMGNFVNTCRVRGAGEDTDSSSVGLFLNLTCIGNTPSTGTGLLDGVITLRRDTNFTWSGLTIHGNTPDQIQATRAPNDGADDAMVQHWIVKGAVFDFTNTFQIIGIGVGNITGSFEGELKWDGENTITQTPDAVGEPSDILFTGISPVETDGAYTATINMRADDLAIPTATQTASGRELACIGQVVVGTDVRIGTTEARNISKPLLDFSDIVRLTEGDFRVFPRHATYEINCNTLYAQQDGQKVQRIIRGLSPAKPAFFYVPDFPNVDGGSSASTIPPLGSGFYLYGVVQRAVFSFDPDNEPTPDWGERVQLKIGGLV